MECENRTLKLSLEKSRDQTQNQISQIQILEEKKTRLLNQVAEMDQKLLSEETIRRQLHNTIQELKGNIRVFCRIRPPLGKEEEEDSLSHIAFSETDEGAIELTQSTDNASGSKVVSKTYPFTFDKVYSI